MIIRKARPEDRQQIREIAAHCFEFALHPEPADAKLDEETNFRWAALEDDDQTVMGSVTVNDYRVYFDGNVCRMGGIGGVSTLPQYRRQGCIRKCFDAALSDMCASGYTFSYLYPFSTAYYRKFGYESCIEKHFMTVKLHTLKPDAVSGYFHMNHSRAPLADDIRSIDHRWERQFNMMIQHDEGHYAWVFEDDPAARMEYTYVYYAADGTPKGYTSFRPERINDNRDLNCTRFCFIDREGFHGLMQIFKSMSADHRAVKFILPAVPGIQHLPSELALESVDCVTKTVGMVRVIHVKNALMMTKYRGSGQIRLAVTDPQIPENNRSFAICFENGRAVSVDETDDTADAVMDIAPFSSLLLGTADFSDVRHYITGIRVLNENACFDQVFYRKKMMIADFF